MPPDRRHTNPAGDQYTPEEEEFLAAVERYKRQKRRPFPALTELLAVLRSLGWSKGGKSDVAA